MIGTVESTWQHGILLPAIVRFVPNVAHDLEAGYRITRYGNSGYGNAISEKARGNKYRYIKYESINYR